MPHRAYTTVTLRREEYLRLREMAREMGVSVRELVNRLVEEAAAARAWRQVVEAVLDELEVYTVSARRWLDVARGACPAEALAHAAEELDRLHSRLRELRAALG